MAGGGEWLELVDLLVASLGVTGAPVTSTEREELRSLLGRPWACPMTVSLVSTSRARALINGSGRALPRKAESALQERAGHGPYGGIWLASRPRFRWQCRFQPPLPSVRVSLQVAATSAYGEDRHENE